MKFDLHCHSHFSDGKHTANFLIERALANNVTHLALTDHDCTDVHVDLDGYQELTIIKGVEISCAWMNHEFHIVGLSINPQHLQLENLLSSQQEKRRQRVREVDAKLLKIGIHGLLPYMLELSAVAQTRSHVADFLVKQQFCKTRKTVFKQYLNKGGKAYVSPHWCNLEEAVGAIKSGGGIAVLAHPGRYGITRTKLSYLVDAFKSAGGQAIECTYPSIAMEMQAHLVKLAVNNGLYLSCGSDFHDASAKWTDVGKFPALPENTNQYAVWHHPSWGETAPTLTA
jgi:predicted metal-dependent phosphoesterase TrpH